MATASRDHSTDVVLSATDIVAGYDDLTILHGVSITVRRDELVAVIGPNGAGKSTLLKVISGVVPAREGSIQWRRSEANTIELTKQSASQRATSGLGLVPQVDNVFPNMSVLDNLKVGGSVKGRGAKAALDGIYAEFPLLHERRKQRAGTLSGGQRKMLALARALMADPVVLLLDEPTAALSPSASTELIEKLAELRSRGVSIFLVEQNARRALSVADYAYVLDMGRNRFEGISADLLGDDAIVRLYLGDRPSLRAPADR